MSNGTNGGDKTPWGKIPGSNKGLPQIKLPEFHGAQMIYILLAGLVLWLLTGIFMIGPDEQGVIRRFGKYDRIVGSGLGYHLPAPIEKVSKPKITQVKRAEIGFRTIDPGPPARYREVLKEALMLTEDENIINVNLVVQYRIKDTVDYLFNVRDVEKTVRDVSEASIREVIGRTRIDEALTTAHAQIQSEVRDLMQDVLDHYKAGLQIITVQLQDVKPPAEVIGAFKDVVSATKDKRKTINEAKGYKEKVLPDARGEAAKIVRAAKAYQDRKIKHAHGDAEKFLQVLKEYKKARKITRTRLYLETMESILPEMEKFVVESNSKGNLLQFLPIAGGNRSRGMK
jgi:membrane protease subunit HflK